MPPPHLDALCPPWQQVLLHDGRQLGGSIRGQLQHRTHTHTGAAAVQAMSARHSMHISKVLPVNRLTFDAAMDAVDNEALHTYYSQTHGH